jgi:hypothetical protein
MLELLAPLVLRMLELLVPLVLRMLELLAPLVLQLLALLASLVRQSLLLRWLVPLGRLWALHKPVAWHRLAGIVGSIPGLLDRGRALIQKCTTNSFIRLLPIVRRSLQSKGSVHHVEYFQKAPTCGQITNDFLVFRWAATCRQIRA